MPTFILNHEEIQELAKLGNAVMRNRQLSQEDKERYNLLREIATAESEMEKSLGKFVMFLIDCEKENASYHAEMPDLNAIYQNFLAGLKKAKCKVVFEKYWEEESFHENDWVKLPNFQIEFTHPALNRRGFLRGSAFYN